MFLAEMLHCVSHGIRFKHAYPLQNKTLLNNNAHRKSIRQGNTDLVLSKQSSWFYLGVRMTVFSSNFETWKARPILKVYMEKKINFWLPYIPTIIVDTFLNHREQ